jgi:Enoyl-(Acyl carrier protein) reductase
MEFVADGIRANTISPGVVDTPMHAGDDHEILKKLQPIPRLVQISETVDALLYLQSAPMVNGENIRIDGGAMQAPSGNQRSGFATYPTPLGAYESSDAGNLLSLSGILPVANGKLAIFCRLVWARRMFG